MNVGKGCSVAKPSPVKGKDRWSAAEYDPSTSPEDQMNMTTSPSIHAAAEKSIYNDDSCWPIPCQGAITTSDRLDHGISLHQIPVISYIIDIWPSFADFSSSNASPVPMIRPSLYLLACLQDVTSLVPVGLFPI